MENLQLVCSDGRMTNLCRRGFNGYDLRMALTPVVHGQHHPPVGLAIRAAEAAGVITDVALWFHGDGYVWTSGSAAAKAAALPSGEPVEQFSAELIEPLKGIQCLASRSSGIVNVRFHT